jgi:superoxide reductase
MAEINQVFKCEICGNVIEVVGGGKGTLVCCDKPMVLQVENTVDASKEKHVPVVEKTAKGYKVKIGSVPHPMEEKHYIQFIELMAGAKVLRHTLKPGDAPEAEFETSATQVTAREHCNIHGLWKA